MVVTLIENHFRLTDLFFWLLFLLVWLDPCYWPQLEIDHGKMARVLALAQSRITPVNP